MTNVVQGNSIQPAVETGFSWQIHSRSEITLGFFWSLISFLKQLCTQGGGRDGTKGHRLWETCYKTAWTLVSCIQLCFELKAYNFQGMLYQETYLEYFILDDLTLCKQNSRAKSVLMAQSFVISRHERRITFQSSKKTWVLKVGGSHELICLKTPS